MTDLLESMAALEKKVERLIEDNRLLRACNESHAAAMSRYWEILVPGYEGDLSFEDMLKQLVKGRQERADAIELLRLWNNNIRKARYVDPKTERIHKYLADQVMEIVLPVWTPVTRPEVSTAAHT